MVIGYLAKSAGSLNWVGLTNMLHIVHVVNRLLSLIKLRCPSCRAPIVGTKPVVYPADLFFARNSCNSAAVFNRIILRGFGPACLFLLHFAVFYIPLPTYFQA